MSQLQIQVSQFANFPHVNDVKRIDSTDEEVLSRIRTLLIEMNAVDRFGVHLIHKHYEISDDEIVVEYTDEDARIQTTFVEKKDTLSAENPPLETQWRFTRDSASMVCQGYCHVDRGHTRRHNSR